jgi:hypothetical protein
MTRVGQLHEVLVGVWGQPWTSQHLEDISVLGRIILKWIFNK